VKSAHVRSLDEVCNYNGIKMQNHLISTG